MKGLIAVSVLMLAHRSAWCEPVPNDVLRFAVTGTTVNGTLNALAADWSADVGGERLPPGELVELVQVGQARPAWPDDRPHLQLVNGDRWPGHVLDIHDDRVRSAPDFGAKQECSLPVSAVAAACLRPMVATISDGKRSTDEVRLVNGDVMRGTLIALDARTVTIEFRGQKQAAPRDGIAVLAFNTDLSRTGKVQPSGRVVLADGTRVTLANATLQDGRLVGKTVAGPTVRLLLANVVALTVVGGRATDLSDLKPLRYEHTPYLGVTWPLGVNRSVVGDPLRLAGDTFDRGLGLHSRSAVSFAIPAGTRRFETWVGLDAATGRLGRAAISVDWDGKSAWGPRVMVGGQPPERLELAVPPGAKVITLKVDFGPGGDVQDHVDFADARFVAVSRR